MKPVRLATGSFSYFRWSASLLVSDSTFCERANAVGTPYSDLKGPSCTQPDF